MRVSSSTKQLASIDVSHRLSRGLIEGVYGFFKGGIMALSDKHLNTVRNDFSEEDTPRVIAELGRITVAETMDSDYNLQKAIGAILSLSKGDFEELRNLVTAAKIDFRDVIYWWYLENKKATHHE